MYKKTLYYVCEGKLCHASAAADGMTVITEENGRLIRRKMTSGGKAFGARPASYGSGYFEFAECTVEIIGDDVRYKSTDDAV